MDDFSNYIFLVILTGVSCALFYLAKKAQKITQKKEALENFSQAQNQTSLKESIEPFQNLDESSDWFSSFLVNHPYFCEFFSHPLVYHTCKISFFCSTLFLVHQTVKIIPSLLIPPENSYSAGKNDPTTRDNKLSDRNLSTKIILIGNNNYHFILTKQQKNNAVFLELFKKCEKKFQKNLIEIFTNTVTKYDVRKQILAMARVLGINQIKLSNGCLVKIPV